MPLPGSLTTRTVTGEFFKGDGTPETGTVTFKRSTTLQNTGDDQFITPYTHTATLDGSGQFTIDLPITDDPEWLPLGWTYEVHLVLSAWEYKFSMLLPGGAALDLADAIPPSDVPDPPSSYVTVTSVGQVGGPAGPLDGDGKIPDGQIALDFVNVGAMPRLSLIPEAGKSWWLTSTPFDASITSIAQEGDRFTYPPGHASAGETYRWTTGQWVLDRVINLPAGAIAGFVSA